LLRAASCLLIAGCLTAQAADTNMFMVLSKFEMKLYGYAKLDASYDTQRTSSGERMYYVYPEVNGESDNEFNMTARETRLGLDMQGPAVDEFKTSGKLESDFYGSGGSANAPNVRLRLAYVNIAHSRGFAMRAGQDQETFTTVTPKILNNSSLGNAGALTSTRSPQFRLTQQIPLGDSKIIAAAAVTRPNTHGDDCDKGGQDDGVDSGAPFFQGNLIFETKWLTEKATKISVSGHYGRETLDSVISNKVVETDSKDYDSWSVMGSLYVPIISQLAVQGTLWQGADLDSYGGGIGQGINTTLEKSIAAAGGWGELVLNLTEVLNLNVGYGIDDPKDSDLSKGNRSKNQIFFASLYYKITSAATVALEYSRMQTEYKGSSDADNNRFQGAVSYNF